MSGRARSNILGISVLASGILVVALGWFMYRLYQHGKWDLNGARVWAIARLLEIDHPESVQGEVLVDLLKRHGISADQALDAWGRPLMVEVQHGPDDE